jgi:hypothetical protein
MAQSLSTSAKISRRAVRPGAATLEGRYHLLREVSFQNWLAFALETYLSQDF